jgi:hypothetical protein
MWTLGQCANCGVALNHEHPALFCCDPCRDTAKNIRYFRRCYREGRIADPDVLKALHTRMAFQVGGGYDAKARHLDTETRQAVLADNSGLCWACNAAPATQVDHISGPSSDRANLQGLCVTCHDIKTNQSMVPMTDEDKARRDAFMVLVNRPEPLMSAHDELTWDAKWRARLAETRQWAASVHGHIEAGYFGDGSTGTAEDFEHADYLTMLAERED